MIKNPQKIAESSAITGTFAVQQNAIDFPLDELFIISQQWGYLSNDKSLVKHKFRQPVQLTSNVNYLQVDQAVSGEHDAMGWVLMPNTSYDGISNVYVEVPEGMAAMLVARSTLNRNSIKLTSGLYDAGFKGHIGFVLRNETGHTFIEKGTFVGQIIFFDADNAALYSGAYSAPQGESWIGTSVENTAPVEAPQLLSFESAPVETPVPVEETPVIEETPVETEVAADEQVETKDLDETPIFEESAVEETRDISAPEAQRPVHNPKRKR